MESVIITPINLEKICRVCLTESEKMYSIYSELYEVNNANEEIPCIFEILLSISSIRIEANDGLPSLICMKCIDSAHSSYKFQKQCNKSQTILDAYLTQINEITQSDNLLITDDLIAQINENELIKQPEENTQYMLINQQEEEVDDPKNIELCQDPDIDLNLSEDSKNEQIMNNDVCFNDAAENDDDILKDMLRFEETKSNETDNTKAKEENKVKLATLSKMPNMRYYYKVLENGDKVFACNLCPKQYKYGSSLRIHLKNHTQERPYMCNLCGKDFKLYGSLIYHQRSHSGEQPYACKICGKRYKQSGTLTAHMRVHTGQRPFLCSICGRGFRQAPDLGYHMRTHTKEKPYMCNICGKTMSMQCHLVQHMRTHTGERPFKCTVCNKAFPSSTRLKRHAITHTDLKPYTCEVCDKSFNRSSSLRVHSKIHTAERPHVCSICSKGFIQASALRGHLLTHSIKFITEPKLE